jgi:predicted ATP-dependent serine protease
VSAEQPKPTRPAPALVGRIEEVARLRDVLSSANHDGQALLISGEPGVGKSMLLQAAEHLAADAGVRVLKATGSQFEADISYAGLHQLLFPLLDTISVLPDWQRQALEAALGLA